MPSKPKKKAAPKKRNPEDLKNRLDARELKRIHDFILDIALQKKAGVVLVSTVEDEPRSKTKLDGFAYINGISSSELSHILIKHLEVDPADLVIHSLFNNL